MKNAETQLGEESFLEFGYIPGNFYIDFIKFLSKNNQTFNVLTYDDLDWRDDYNHANGYPSEWKRWKEGLKNGRFDPTKIHLILQHDVDAHPARTLKFLEVEAEYGLRSNVMIFRRRIRRHHYLKTGKLEYSDYSFDQNLLRSLCETRGFVIGYHSNAYDQSHFDTAAALEIFAQDVTALRETFDIRYFSPHGGLRDKRGASNNALSIPSSLQGSIRWVANRFSPRFSGQFSDGGINTIRAHLGSRDLRSFFETLQPGNRYFVLTHLQYYSTPTMVARGLKDKPWYQEVLSSYENIPEYSAWKFIKPKKLPVLARLRQNALLKKIARISKRIM